MSERFAWIFDKQKQKKIWCADMWARKAVLAIRTAITGITSRLATIEGAGYQTASDVSAAIASAIGGITELEYLVVSTLPASGAKGVVYLVPHQHGTRDIYDEYIWVNNAFEKIGSTDVDLSQYLLKTDISAWAKASTKPTYTASEVGALPDTTAIPSKVSDLTNDSGFQTGTQVSNAISAEAGLMVPYGYCTTAAATVAKVVTVSPAVTELTTGLTIAVKFQYANTGSNPTLDVNSLGAKAIKRYGTTAAGTSAAANWNANSVVMLVYDGTYWQLADWNNTTYSGMSDAEYQAGTGTSNRLITPARLKAAIELHAPVQSVNGATGAVTVTVPTKVSDLTNDSGFITGYTETDPTVPLWAKASSKPSYTASEVGALPDTTAIPSKTSDLMNDSGYITGYTETDPTVPAWAKASTKPTYTAAEVGALPDTTVIPSVPSNISAFTNDAGYVTASAVPDASTATPVMDGTGAAGASADYARADHVHPSDSSKQDALTAAQMAAVDSGITSDDLAVNDHSVICAVTPIVPTLNTGTHYSTYGGCWYYKIGSRVRLHIGVNGLTASTQTTLWTMPAGYRPRSGIAFTGQGSSSANYSRCRVTSAGDVWVNVSSGVLATAYCEYDAFA